MKKAVVTGANGFIGQWLTALLSKIGVGVIAVVRGKDSDLSGIAGLPGVRIVSCTLERMASLPAIAGDRDCDVFFHLAWDGVTGAARADCGLQLRNAQSSVDALRAAAELGCKRFVYAGSIMEDEAAAAVSIPGCRPGPGYIYGCGKLAGHMLCTSSAEGLGVEYVSAKITNAYGPGERTPRFLSATVRKIISGEELLFTSGTQNYDFIYIEDAARALFLAAENGRPFHTYLIGSGAARPLKDFILEIKKVLAPEREFAFGKVPFTGVSLPLSAFDCSAAERDLGFRAEIPFAEGLKRTMAWAVEQGDRGT